MLLGPRQESKVFIVELNSHTQKGGRHRERGDTISFKTGIKAHIFRQFFKEDIIGVALILSNEKCPK